MDIHENARLTWHSRAELVRRVRKEGQTPKAVRKWVKRPDARSGSGPRYSGRGTVREARRG